MQAMAKQTLSSREQCGDWCYENNFFDSYLLPLPLLYTILRWFLSCIFICRRLGNVHLKLLSQVRYERDKESYIAKGKEETI